MSDTRNEDLGSTFIPQNRKENLPPIILSYSIYSQHRLPSLMIGDSWSSSFYFTVIPDFSCALILFDLFSIFSSDLIASKRIFEDIFHNFYAPCIS